VIVAQALDGKSAAAIGAWLDGVYEGSDPWHGYTVGAILRDSATWRPVEHVPSGFAAIDDALGGGWRCGGVHLIGGFSGKGKSQIALATALAAAKADVPTGIVSLEMSCRDLAQLSVAQLADVPRSWLAKGGVRGEPAERLSQAIDRAATLPLWILDDTYWAGPLTRSELAALAREGVRRFGWRLVIVDYLGLLAPEIQDKTDYHVDCANSGVLKRLAAECDIALVALADLRKTAAFKPRKGEAREKQVTLDDFRGAARLTYDAQSVFFLDSTQAENPGGYASGVIRLFALKTRFSAAGSKRTQVQLRWYPATGRILDLQDMQEPDAELSDAAADEPPPCMGSRRRPALRIAAECEPASEGPSDGEYFARVPDDLLVETALAAASELAGALEYET